MFCMSSTFAVFMCLPLSYIVTPTTSGVVRWYCVTLQCRGVLLIWIIVGQRPPAHEVGAKYTYQKVFQLTTYDEFDLMLMFSHPCVRIFPLHLKMLLQLFLNTETIILPLSFYFTCEIIAFVESGDCLDILSFVYHLSFLLSCPFYTPNFGEVEGAYLFGPVRQSVCP